MGNDAFQLNITIGSNYLQPGNEIIIKPPVTLARLSLQMGMIEATAIPLCMEHMDLGQEIQTSSLSSDVYIQ